MSAPVLFVYFVAAGFINTLGIAVIAKVACQFIDVVSERAVIWCLTLGYFIGKAREAHWRTDEPFGPKEADAFGTPVGQVLALALLWWFLYRRHRDRRPLNYSDRL